MYHIYNAYLRSKDSSRWKLFLVRLFGQKTHVISDDYVMTLHVYKGDMYLTKVEQNNGNSNQCSQGSRTRYRHF